ncbi:hypothetical protein GN956_G25669 [Arapaima gigas]
MALPSEVKAPGDNSVFLHVSDDVFPANIALGAKPVIQGEDVDLKCTLPDLQSQDWDRNAPLYAYLSKDGVGVQIQIWDREKFQANFTIPRDLLKITIKGKKLFHNLSNDYGC